MNLLPDSNDNNRRDSSELTNRQNNAISRAEAKAIVDVGKHQAEAWKLCQFDQIDTMALIDAVRFSFDEEVSLLDHGLARCGNSPAKAQLLAAKLELASTITNQRISRRFGR